MPEIIEGRNPVIEALKVGHPIIRILIIDSLQDTIFGRDVKKLAAEKNISVEPVTRTVIERASATGHSQGIIAFVQAPDYLSLETILDIPRSKGEPALFCVLDGIEDPHNFGAIIRTADAAGFHGIIIRERRAAGLTATVSRTSAGAVEYVPVAAVVNISQTLEKLKANGIWVVGLDMSGNEEFNSVDYSAPTAIVIGSEGKGLSDLVRKKCDILTRIPMVGHINSLNTSVAAALVMYAAFMKRLQKST